MFTFCNEDFTYKQTTLKRLYIVNYELKWSNACYRLRAKAIGCMPRFGGESSLLQRWQISKGHPFHLHSPNGEYFSA